MLAYGGHQAALARQAAPSIETGDCGQAGCVFKADVGRWDPGVSLEAWWTVNGKPSEPFEVAQGETLTYKPEAHSKWSFLQLWVTARKSGYVEETRQSNSMVID